MEAFRDFSEFFALLNAHEVRFLVIGGVAYNYYAEPRQTKDIDVWVEPEVANLERLRDVIAAFGFPVDDVHPDKLMAGNAILMLGVPPWRIDVLMEPLGVSFDGCYHRAVSAHYGAEPIGILALQDLVPQTASSFRD
jgi:hypothetical protein